MIKNGLGVQRGYPRSHRINFGALLQRALSSWRVNQEDSQLGLGNWRSQRPSTVLGRIATAKILRVSRVPPTARPIARTVRAETHLKASKSKAAPRARPSSLRLNNTTIVPYDGDPDPKYCADRQAPQVSTRRAQARPHPGDTKPTTQAFERGPTALISRPMRERVAPASTLQDSRVWLST